MPVIKGLNSQLAWLRDLLALFENETIKIPSDYRDKVLETKKLLKDDPSGLINTLLDFAISCATRVDYYVETDNKNLTNTLNAWLKNLNSDLRGKIPTGLSPLAKEYFRERWKGSSFLLLRTFWEKRDELNLPMTLFFLDGEDIKNKPRNPNDKVMKLGDENYAIRINDDESKDIKLPTNKNELIFAQKPYDSWGERYPTPFIIRRGCFRASKFLGMISGKGEHIVGKALEYLMVLKKGSEKMLIDGKIGYSQTELQQVSDDLKEIIERKKSEAGASTYTTHFDTELEHFIPDYKKAIDSTLYTPHEKKILAGLGVIEITQEFSLGSTRRQSQLDPKPFISEIEQAIEDFKSMINDILVTIKEKNIDDHKKWMNIDVELKSTPIKDFITNEIRQVLRSVYDRGKLSNRTFAETVANVDYDEEVRRREEEHELGHDEKMFAPVVQNNGQLGVGVPPAIPINKNTGKEPAPSKTGPEKKNYLRANCNKCMSEFYYETAVKINDDVIKCPICEEELTNEDVSFNFEFDESQLEYEEAPYKQISELPNSVKMLPSEGQSLWMRVFNQSYSKGESYARKMAWTVVKQSYFKDKDGKWKKRKR